MSVVTLTLTVDDVTMVDQPEKDAIVDLLDEIAALAPGIVEGVDQLELVGRQAGALKIDTVLDTSIEDASCTAQVNLRLHGLSDSVMVLGSGPLTDLVSAFVTATGGIVDDAAGEFGWTSEVRLSIKRDA